MVVPLTDFLKHLAESGLLGKAEVQQIEGEFAGNVGTPDDARRVAEELVSRKRLTRFQAETLLSGTSSGLVYGNYVVLDQLGQGGMGLVFEAEHRRMRRRVALKVMSPRALKSEDSVRRFRREVEAAARLIHPNIVAAYDADEASGAHFLVMELVTGRDLSARVKQDGPLPVAEAVSYVIQAARGLDHAHNAGIVHRDIKPANLLLDESGVVKVLDLGMARLDESLSLASSAAATLTHTGSIMGTIDFMSPEQALDTRHADRRADIYSLGCSLYYLLTGRPLYAADTMMKKLLAHREHPIPSLRSARSDVSPALEAAFTRMVAKLPEDRFQTMEDVVAALRATADREVSLPGSPHRPPVDGHHSTILPDEWRPAQGNRDTDIVRAQPMASNLQAGPVPAGETRELPKPPGAAPRVADQPAPETRRLSRRQWMALAISTGLLVMLAFVPWFGPQHRAIQSELDGRSASLRMAQPAGEDAKSKGADRAGRDRIRRPADGWLDLWAEIDIQHDLIFGEWERTGDVLIGADHGRDAVAARLMLPCRPRGSYELSFRLKRLWGESGIAVMLPAGGRAVALVIAGFPDQPGEGGPLTGLHLLDGKPLPLSPDRVRGPRLELNRAYEMKVRVLETPENVAILLEVDDDRVFDWKGRSDRFELAPLYQIPDPRNLGLGTFNSAVELHDLEFRVIEGEATLGERPQPGGSTLPRG